MSIPELRANDFGAGQIAIRLVYRLNILCALFICCYITGRDSFE
jgi:hypothetical protein